MRPAIVDQDDLSLARRKRLAIQFDLSDPPAYAMRIVDADLIAGGPMPEDNLKVRPVRRYARRQR